MGTALGGPQLDFVRFWSGPGPEDAVFSDVVEGLIEGQDASAHIVDICNCSRGWQKSVARRSIG